MTVPPEPPEQGQQGPPEPLPPGGAGVPDAFGRLWTPHRLAYIKGEG